MLPDTFVHISAGRGASARAPWRPPRCPALPLQSQPLTPGTRPHSPRPLLCLPLQEVRDRRAKTSRYLNDPEFKKQCDAENRAKFKARMEEEKANNPEPKFGIIIPMVGAVCCLGMRAWGL